MHSNVRLFVHVVWATWDRQPVIDEPMRAWLWPAIAEKARAMGSTHVVVGGVADHIHVLTELPNTVSVADLAKHLKGAPSALIGQRQGRGTFRWQRGYGAFTLRPEDIPVVESYVRDQANHHGTHVVRPELEGTSFD